jgi:HlyD family secretion protein
MKDFPKGLIYLIAGVAIATILVLAFRPAPIPVDVAPVERGNLRVTVDDEGKTRIRNRYVVSTPISGRLARIQLDEGDRVKQGQVVARIDGLPFNTQVREALARLRELRAERRGVETRRPKQEALLQAQARIRSAQAEAREAQTRIAQARAALNQARRDRQRTQQLYAEGAIARQALENAELEEITRVKELEAAQQEAESAIAEVTAAREALAILKAEQRDPDYLLEVYDARIASVEAELANLADRASRTEINSPVDGTVLRILQESARYVEEGTPLLELGNPSELEIVVDLLSTDAVKVQPGATVLIERWGGDRTLTATVRYIEPSAFTEISALGVEEQRVNVIADLDQDSVPLGDGYRVEARIVVWEGKNVLQVPLSALFRCAEAWCTFVVRDGKAQRREVKVSQRNNFAAAIAGGLEEGELVILHPTEEIETGDRVKSRRGK